MTARQTNRDDSDLSLPPVDPKTIQSVEGEGIDTDSLYKRIHQDDAETALYIRRRAIQLAPEDLDNREEIAKLALQAVELKNKQTLINGLSSRLVGHPQKVSKKSTKAAKANLSRPPLI
jgi:hypothetical protein